MCYSTDIWEKAKPLRDLKRSLWGLGICSTNMSQGGFHYVNGKTVWPDAFCGTRTLCWQNSLIFSTGIDSRCACWILDFLWAEDWMMTCWVISMEIGIRFLPSQRRWLLISILLHHSWPSNSPLVLVTSPSLRQTLQIWSSPNLDQQQCELWGINILVV